MVAGPGSCGGGKLPFLEPGLSSQGSPSTNYTTSCCVSVGLGLDFPEADSEMEVWAQKFVWFFFFGGESTLGINSCETGEETGLDRGRSWDAT